MTPTPSSLTARLRARIHSAGAISFADFMQTALYDPSEGYYGAGRARLGSEGDFFTSVSVGPLFGRLLARQFIEMWRLLGQPAPFRLIEQGAHDGTLAHDVLAALHEFAPSCARATELCLVEPSAHWQARQRERLAGFAGQVRWIAEAGAHGLTPAPGVAYSNELLDAFPVHRVRWNGEAWLELAVTVADDRFSFVERGLANPNFAAHLPTDLPAGYTTEVRTGLGNWLSETASLLSQGWVLAIDYGYLREDYYRPERDGGTLSAYAAHQRVDDPLQTPGEIDLTAHVDFTSLLEAAPAAGLTLCGFTDQQRLMAGLGRLHFEDTMEVSPVRAKEQRAFMTLLHPGLLGASFKAICFGKDVATAALPLSAFHFAQPR